MAEITAALVKQLRERTGAGMMECKKALGRGRRRHRSGRCRAPQTRHRLGGQESLAQHPAGVIGTYVHPGGQLGVLVEVNCESDFVARTDDFQELVKDSRCRSRRPIRSSAPRRRAGGSARKREGHPTARAIAEGKPEKVAREDRRGPHGQVLRRGLPVRSAVREGEHSDRSTQLIKTKIAKLGENISVARFARFKVGRTVERERGNA